MAKIYVSSTFLDLQECRAQVERVIRRMGHEDMAMEYYVAEDQRPVAKCLADVAVCDVYIGIFAWRYGWQPQDNNPDQLSITELEFRQAEKTGKQCLVFLLSEDAAWPRKFIDKETARIERLRDESRAKHLVSQFNSADDLAVRVAEAIHQWQIALQSKAPVEKPKRKVHFHTLPLPDTNRFSLPECVPPLVRDVKGVEFKLRSGDDGKPQCLRVMNDETVLIRADSPRSVGVFILLNAEYAFYDLGKGISGLYRTIGEIVLNFSDTDSITKVLKLGVNIRDWCPTYRSAINEWASEPDPNVSEAWQETDARGLLMDMLKVEWGKPQHLISMVVKHHLDSPINPEHIPNIFIWAISCGVE